MKTLTINIENQDRETAICMFLDALQVEYKVDGEMDETEYLLSSPANAEHLKKSMEQEARGEGVKITLDVSLLGPKYYKG